MLIIPEIAEFAESPESLFSNFLVVFVLVVVRH